MAIHLYRRVMGPDEIVMFRAYDHLGRVSELRLQFGKCPDLAVLFAIQDYLKVRVRKARNELN
jgi:hypothetical protein